MEEDRQEGEGPPLSVPPSPPSNPEGVDREENEGMGVREPPPLPPAKVPVGGEEGVVDGAEALGEEESDTVGLFDGEPLALPKALGEREGEGEVLSDPNLSNPVGVSTEVTLLPPLPRGDSEGEALPVRDGPSTAPVGDAMLEGVPSPAIPPPKEEEGMDDSEDRGEDVKKAEGDEKGDAVSTFPVYIPMPMVGLDKGVGVSKVIASLPPPREGEEEGVAASPTKDALEAVVAVNVGRALSLVLPLLECNPEGLRDGARDEVPPPSPLDALLALAMPLGTLVRVAAKERVAPEAVEQGVGVGGAV